MKRLVSLLLAFILCFSTTIYAGALENTLDSARIISFDDNRIEIGAVIDGHNYIMDLERSTCIADIMDLETNDSYKMFIKTYDPPEFEGYIIPNDFTGDPLEHLDEFIKVTENGIQSRDELNRAAIPAGWGLAEEILALIQFLILNGLIYGLLDDVLKHKNLDDDDFDHPYFRAIERYNSKLGTNCLWISDSISENRAANLLYDYQTIVATDYYHAKKVCEAACDIGYDIVISSDHDCKCLQYRYGKFYHIHPGLYTWLTDETTPGGACFYLA